MWLGNTISWIFLLHVHATDKDKDATTGVMIAETAKDNTRKER